MQTVIDARDEHFYGLHEMDYEEKNVCLLLFPCFVGTAASVTISRSRDVTQIPARVDILSRATTTSLPSSLTVVHY
jgi:hypothetical protein